MRPWLVFASHLFCMGAVVSVVGLPQSESPPVEEIWPTSSWQFFAEQLATGKK